MDSATVLSRRELALVRLGRYLVDHGYHFTSVTPATHRRVLDHGEPPELTLRDVFGWSRPFDAALDREVVRLLDEAGCLVPVGARLRSLVRYSSLGGRIFVHSAYPTTDADAVFFGPDSHRFVALLEREIARASTVIDVGAGSGVGGLSLADRVDRIVLTDVNPTALSFARVNAEFAGVSDRVTLVDADVLRGVHDRADVIISNPPFMADPEKRSYRDGGHLGIDLTLRIAHEALAHLDGRGQLVVYSGAPVIAGEDQLRKALLPILPAGATYEELDPDIFGEELTQPAYRHVERIAAVAVCFAA